MFIHSFWICPFHLLVAAIIHFPIFFFSFLLSHPHIELIITDDVSQLANVMCVAAFSKCKTKFSVRFVFFFLSPIDSGWGDIFWIRRKLFRSRRSASSSSPFARRYKNGISLHHTQKRGRGWIGSIWGETCRRDSAGRHSLLPWWDEPKENQRNTNQKIKGRHFFFFFWVSSFFDHLLNCESHRIIWAHPCQ